MKAMVKHHLQKSQANLERIKRDLSDTPSYMKKGYGQRILARAKELGLKNKDLAVASHVSPQAVTQWIKEDTEPRPEHLYLLAKLLKKSENYFRYGSDNSDTGEESSIALVDLREQKSLPWLDLDIVNRANLRSVMKQALSRNSVYPVVPGLEDGAVFTIKDSSMSPDFKHGDVIIIDLNAAFHAGEFIVIDCRPLKKTLFRKLQRREGGFFALVPCNQDHEVHTFPQSELGKTYHVLGVLDRMVIDMKPRNR